MFAFLSDKTERVGFPPFFFSSQSDYGSRSWTGASRISRDLKKRILLSETVCLCFLYKNRKKIARRKRDYALKNCEYIDNM